MPSEPNAVAPKDIFLGADLSPEAAARFLEGCGVRDGAAADQQLQQLADDLTSRVALGNLAPLLFDEIATTPDPDAAVVGFCRYVATRTPKASFIGTLQEDPHVLDILAQILGTSPFLSEILIRNPGYLHWLRNELDSAPPDRHDYDRELARLIDGDSSVELQVDGLKRYQRREMLRVAALDLFGMLNQETLTSTTAQLSNLADTLVDKVLDIATAEQAAADGPLPGRFAVIGMGKLGGGDLNYSSDIDLIYVYDAPDDTTGTAQRRYQKLGRRLTSLLSAHTGEGYLYRVDMRLRPMGQGGNLVYSLKQSAQYYESMGETFERFALIKARPIAGDLDLGRRFVELTVPFVYRKYLDHAAIEELARYKARADREHGKRGDLDQNVKEGRGGIREIELFAQVFQIIYGGETPDLRTGHTLTALDHLGAHGFIEPEVQRDLAAAYVFLRNIEHGLQVAQGQQTHTLSGTERGLRALARRLGFDDLETLTGVLDRHRDRVHAVYADLFEGEQEDGGLAGREMFRLLSGDMSDDDARARLAEAGVDEPGSALDAMRALDAAPSHGWSSARNLLANLLAEMLAGGTPAGLNRMLVRFERVASRSGAAGALFRTLLDDEELRRRFVSGLDAGDLYAARLAAYPELLDSLGRAVVDSDTFRDEVVRGFDEVTAGDEPAFSLDPFRRVKAIEEFKALVEWLTERRLDKLNEKLSLVADCALQAAARVVSHHRAPGPGPAGPETGWAVFALGKLGSRELTVHSDLDIVFLYAGDGSWFEPQQKFVRAIHDLLSKRTGAGAAYEIDTRLRPEGRMGALALSVAAFERYLRERAEIWERMGVDALPLRGRRRGRRRAGGGGRRGVRVRAVVAGRRGLRPAHPHPHRARARRRGGGRAPRSQARARGPRRHRLPAAGAAAPRGAGPPGVPGRGGAAPAGGVPRHGLPAARRGRRAARRLRLSPRPRDGAAHRRRRGRERHLDGSGRRRPVRAPAPGAHVGKRAARALPRDYDAGPGDLRDGHGPPGRRFRRVIKWPTTCWRGRPASSGPRSRGKLLDAGHAVLGVDDLNDAYDVRLKHWRLERLQGRERFTFRRADVRDRSGLEAACDREPAIDGVLDLAARAGVRASVEDPWAFVEHERHRHPQPARSLPTPRRAEVSPRVDLQPLRRGRRHAAPGGRGHEPAAEPVRGHEAGGRGAVPRLSPSVRARRHRPALLHRLRPRRAAPT